MSRKILTPIRREGKGAAAPAHAAMRAHRCDAHIKAARAAAILCAGREEAHGAASEDLIDYLRHREDALDRFDAPDHVGAALLGRIGAIGADLMVMKVREDSH